MTRNDVIAELQSVFDSVFFEKIEVTSDLSADKVDEWDSLTHISLLLAIEKTFQIRFRTGEVEATKNVGEFADLIIRRRTEK